MAFVILWVISLSITSSRFIYVVANGKISFFFRLSNIPVCLCVSRLLYRFIYPWARRGFHTLAIVMMLQWVRGCQPQSSKAVHPHRRRPPSTAVSPSSTMSRWWGEIPLITGRLVLTWGLRMSEDRPKPVVEISFSLAIDYSKCGHLTQLWPTEYKGKSGNLRQGFVMRLAMCFLKLLSQNDTNWAAWNNMYISSRCPGA